VISLRALLGLVPPDLVLLGAFVVLGAVVCSPAHADDAVAATEEARQAFDAAARAEERGDVRGAVAGYRASVAAAPTSRHALRAERRLSWLEPRAAEDIDALGALLAYRNRGDRDLADLDALEARMLALSAGLVRREAMMTIATELDTIAAEDGSPAEIERAERAYQRALAEPDLGDAERAQLVAGYATLLGREGRNGEALILLDREGHESGSIRSRLELARIDAWARPVAWSILLSLGLAAAWLGARAMRASSLGTFFDLAAWKVPLVTIVYVVVGPYLLGLWYSTEAAHLAGELAIYLAASLFAAASIGRARELSPLEPRWGAMLRALSGLAPLAAGYLAIYGVGDGPLTH
jgi:hypothetical protein